jgi:hypothetical protein
MAFSAQAMKSFQNSLTIKTGYMDHDDRLKITLLEKVRQESAGKSLTYHFKMNDSISKSSEKRGYAWLV